MMYDLSADFYEKSSDSQPKYTVLMGSYYPKTINEMEDLGFIEDADSDPGYLDYFMEADQKDLIVSRSMDTRARCLMFYSWATTGRESGFGLLK